MRSAARLLKGIFVDIYWMFRGAGIRMPPIPVNPRSILFVCKGSICRSVFAEHLASKIQDKGLVSRMKFGSAGLDVPLPISSPNDAIQCVKPFGIHLENHRSQSISLDLVKSYDMIIAMEVWQYIALQSSFGQQREKLFLLPLLGSKGPTTYSGYAAFNIQDPYGCPPSAFDECFQRISRCIEGLLIRREGLADH